MNYEYQIAGIRVLTDLPFSIIEEEYSKAFIDVPSRKNPDMYLVCHPVQRIPSLPEGGHEENNRCYVEDDMGRRVYFRPAPGKKPYACVVWRRVEPKYLHCYYLEGQESRLMYSMNICDLLGLESLLLQFDGLLLHSAFICWQGQGILFSADSGVGKSTQADLWVKYQGAEILNGDRSGLRKVGGVWTASGLPYAGSSRVYRNESAPVAAIFMLEQAGVNEVQLLTPARALRRLYPQITIHGWDAGYVQSVLPLIEDLVCSVPVYLFRCRPDQEATEIVKARLSRLNLKGTNK